MFAVYLGMARPPLPFRLSAKDQKELLKLLSGGVQQVRVILGAVALLQLDQGVSAPQAAPTVPVTAQAIRKIAHRYSSPTAPSPRRTLGFSIPPDT